MFYGLERYKWEHWFGSHPLSPGPRATTVLPVEQAPDPQHRRRRQAIPCAATRRQREVRATRAPLPPRAPRPPPVRRPPLDRLISPIPFLKCVKFTPTFKVESGVCGNRDFTRNRPFETSPPLRRRFQPTMVLQQSPRIPPDFIKLMEFWRRIQPDLNVSACCRICSMR